MFNVAKSATSVVGISRRNSGSSSRFYDSVDTLLGNQLRGLLSQTIHHYVSLFREEDSTLLPQFKLQLCLEGLCMEFFPSISELESVVCCLVDTVSNAMSQVSTIEVSLI